MEDNRHLKTIISRPRIQFLIALTCEKSYSMDSIGDKYNYCCSRLPKLENELDPVFDGVTLNNLCGMIGDLLV